MLFNLLAEAAETKSWTSYIPIIIIIVLLVAFFVWSYVSQKKKQKAFNDTVNAVKPGSKVKTIGGIVGEVVEINEEEGTFVLKTGDSEGNCSYMKFDKQAIYQTDAKPEPAADKKEAPAAEDTAQKTEELFAESKAEEKQEDAQDGVQDEKEEK